MDPSLASATTRGPGSGSAHAGPFHAARARLRRSLAFLQLGLAVLQGAGTVDFLEQAQLQRERAQVLRVTPVLTTLLSLGLENLSRGTESRSTETTSRSTETGWPREGIRARFRQLLERFGGAASIGHWMQVQPVARAGLPRGLCEQNEVDAAYAPMRGNRDAVLGRHRPSSPELIKHPSSCGLEHPGNPSATSKAQRSHLPWKARRKAPSRSSASIASVSSVAISPPTPTSQ